MWILLFAALLAQEQPTVVRDVSLLPMTDAEAVRADHAVVFHDGAITWIGPSSEAPSVEQVIDGTGLFLAPGLIDAHVHLFDETQLALFVANGVTTVFNMSGTSRALEWRERIRADALMGPRIFTTGPQIKEEGLAFVDTEVTMPTEDEVAALVAMHREQGFDFLKIWSSMPPYVYESILAECRRQGVRVTGHIPSRVGLRGTLASGQRSIAHVEELLNKFFVRELDASGFGALRTIVEGEEVTFISTLITYEMIADTMDDERLDARMQRPENDYLDPFLLELWGSEQNDWWKLRRGNRGDYYDRALPFLVEVTGELHRAGVPVLAGSDAGYLLANVIPGWSLHRELEYLVQAGMTPGEALHAATAATGSFLESDSKLGTIQVGAPADMVLLQANPLEEIASTRSIAGVVLDGHYLDREALDGLLERTAERQEPAHAFLQHAHTDGLEAAVASALDAESSGAAIPGEAGLLVGAFHRGMAGNGEGAFLLADLASRLYPDSYQSAYLLAGLFSMQGNTAAARGELERALELCPTHPLIPVRLEQLGE